MTAGASGAVRSAAAGTMRAGAYYPLQWAAGRLGGGFILAYHNPPGEVFERQMEALWPNEAIPLPELHERARAGRSTRGLFAVTFDDGVGRTVREICGVALRRQWPVTFYLPTEYLDGGRAMPFQLWERVAERLPRREVRLATRRVDLSSEEAMARFRMDVEMAMRTEPRERYGPLIDELAGWLREEGLATVEELKTPAPIGWEEVAALSRQERIGFESHGVTHTAASALSAAELEGELQASRRRIREHTNRDPRHFCYPYGGRESIGAAVPAMVARVYETAVTMRRGRVDRCDWLAAPRIPIYEGDAAGVARLKILTV